jgi:PDDEXK-like domain of unknown function (DUF3799)
MSENTPTLTAGIYYDIPAKDYHADPCPTPSLSSGAARTLLAKSAAHVQIESPRLGGKSREATSAMETGTLVHAILSGNAAWEIDVGEFENYMTKSAKEWRDNTRAAGKIPVLGHDYQVALDCAKIVRKRCAEGLTSSPFDGCAWHEVTCIWQEGETYCRARYDVLHVDEFKNATVWDWKSTADISDRGIERTIAKYRYDIQAAFYLRGLEAQGYRVPQLSFVFVFFETVPPYTVRRVVLSAEYLQQARKEVSQAIQLWQQCLARNEFPTTPPDTMTVEIPHYLSENDGEITID